MSSKQLYNSSHCEKRICGRALARKVERDVTPVRPRIIQEGGFADGMSERSKGIPDSEGIELTRTVGSKAKLPERGANPRRGFSLGL